MLDLDVFLGDNLLEIYVLLDLLIQLPRQLLQFGLELRVKLLDEVIVGAAQLQVLVCFLQQRDLLLQALDEAILGVEIGGILGVLLAEEFVRRLEVEELGLELVVIFGQELQLGLAQRKFSLRFDDDFRERAFYVPHFLELVLVELLDVEQRLWLKLRGHIIAVNPLVLFFFSPVVGLLLGLEKEKEVPDPLDVLQVDEIAWTPAVDHREERQNVFIRAAAVEIEIELYEKVLFLRFLTGVLGVLALVSVDGEGVGVHDVGRVQLVLEQVHRAETAFVQDLLVVRDRCAQDDAVLEPATSVMEIGRGQVQGVLHLAQLAVLPQALDRQLHLFLSKSSLQVVDHALLLLHRLHHLHLSVANALLVFSYLLGETLLQEPAVGQDVRDQLRVRHTGSNFVFASQGVQLLAHALPQVPQHDELIKIFQEVLLEAARERGIV